MKQCKYCGAELPDSAKACSNCGRPCPVEEKPEETPKMTAPEAKVPVESEASWNTAAASTWAEAEEDIWHRRPEDEWYREQGTMNRPSQEYWMRPTPEAFPGQRSMYEPTRTHPMAIVALFLGILAIFFNGLLFLPSIVGITLSIVALTQIRKEPAKYSGRWLAIVGLMLSIGCLIAYIILFAKIYQQVYDALQDPEVMEQVQEYFKLGPAA